MKCVIILLLLILIFVVWNLWEGLEVDMFEDVVKWLCDVWDVDIFLNKVLIESVVVCGELDESVFN